MFCHRCGIQIDDEAEFCHKCGIKIPKMSNNQERFELENSSTFIHQSERSVLSSSIHSNTMEHFKVYVDNHIRNTTKFCSVQELLNSRVSTKFIWICFGIPALSIFTVNNFPQDLILVLVFIVLFGYPAALLTDHIKSSVFLSKNFKAKEIDVEIDIDDLIDFLDEYLNYLNPYFHTWKYIQHGAIGRGIINIIISLIIALLMNKVDSWFGERIGTEFGKNKSCFVIIRMSWFNSDTKKSSYRFGTDMRTSAISRYVCAVKTAPVLDAAMKYYLEEYRKN